MVKMIVSDMDGTLLNSKKQLPGDFTEVYRMMQDAKIRFVVASGRQYYTLVDEFDHLKHDISFIAENGGFIDHDNQKLVVKSLDEMEMKPLVKSLLANEGANVVLCGAEGAYIQRGASDEFMTELIKYYARYSVVDDLLEVKDKILKIAVNHFDALEQEVYPNLLKNFGDRFQISTSSPIWLDVMATGINKGKAIERLQDDWDITPEETMVFGDYLNDLEMLQRAKYSYAMENAHPQIKEVARFEALSNDDNGVILAIRQYLSRDN
ncbi:HAD family hydrolase [Carboxylicivirga sp. M1479]|uniref:HAD family hydrolase n=1 Tax=Carboxylicivirga sp. M1479 TaxID=2594476 RepID=UPI001178CE41|nr:HAD family hydrolase [Carboxylicivirga sp. M1479]TRX71291.1 HAD family hydrolase [Carboxylicivirga sp. M1479]